MDQQKNMKKMGNNNIYNTTLKLKKWIILINNLNFIAILIKDTQISRN